jgi:hypothetical protein
MTKCLGEALSLKVEFILIDAAGHVERQNQDEIDIGKGTLGVRRGHNDHRARGCDDSSHSEPPTTATLATRRFAQAIHLTSS